jgi:peptidoglycan/xylan/chitin deacetylase (PgdA/CDA1 family)
VVEDFETAAKTNMPTLLVSRSMFERQLDWIGRRFQFVSLDEIGDRIARGGSCRKPIAAVTFDDGYSDVYELAFPILKRKGIPAGVFVVTDLIGRTRWQIHDRLYHLMEKAFAGWKDPWFELANLLDRAEIPISDIPRMRAALGHSSSVVPNLLSALSSAEAARVIDVLTDRVGSGLAAVPRALTWPMVAEMRSAGFTIGSHTRSHTWLANESEAMRMEEIEGSKFELEARLGEAVLHFAYPGGQFTPPIVDLVARAGYRFAYTACEHQDARHPVLTIGRLMLWEGSAVGPTGGFSAPILGCQTHQLWPPARKCVACTSHESAVS